MIIDAESTKFHPILYCLMRWYFVTKQSREVLHKDSDNCSYASETTMYSNIQLATDFDHLAQIMMPYNMVSLKICVAIFIISSFFLSSLTSFLRALTSWSFSANLARSRSIVFIFIHIRNILIQNQCILLKICYKGNKNN